MKADAQLLTTIQAHSGSVFSLAVASGNSFYSGSADKHLAEWNLETFTQEKFTVKLDASVYSICKIEEDAILVIGLSNGSIHVVDLKEKKEIRHLKQHRGSVFDLKYNPWKKQLYSCDSEGYFCVWDVPDFRLLLTLPLCQDKIRKMAIRWDNKELTLACGDHKIRILETDFFNEIHSVESHSMAVNSVSYINENILISGGKDAWLKFYDVKNNYSLIHEIPAHNYAIYGIEASPDKRLFATASRDKTIKIFDSETFEFLLRIDQKKYSGHKNSVNCILWHPEMNLLITGSDDRSIKIWKIVDTDV